MSYRVMVLGVALTFGAFGLAADDKKADDKKAVQGVWMYESMEWNGKKVDAEQISMTTSTFDGDKYTVKIGDKVTASGTFKIDPTKSPKTVDVTITEGDGKGNVLPGIYKIDGDTLTTCINLQGADRPTEFKSAERSGVSLVVSKRIKK